MPSGERDLVSAFAVVGVELGLLAGAAGVVHLCVALVLSRLAAFSRGAAAGSLRAVRVRVHRALLLLAGVLALGILGYNGWLLARGVDVTAQTFSLLGVLTVEVWMRLAMVGLRLAAAVIGVLVWTRAVRWALRAIAAAVNRWDQLRDNNRSLAALFDGLNRALASTAWLLFASYGLHLLELPESLRAGFFMLIRAYLAIAIGVLVIRSSTLIVDTLDGLSQKYAHGRGWLRHYDQVRLLLPTFRACLEYALWVALASVALLQLGPMSALAAWGPRLIQAIAIFFLARVVIELGQFEIGRRLLPAGGLDEMSRRRRSTMAPLVRSTFTYAVYFGAAVLMLAALGFNPMPFLAGAGILGLVIGFGAQSLINDVVSGFFILFENTYLVGDMIEAGGGKGVVEAIEFRTTKIRDRDGRVHTIRNGDVKDVINYSRDYTVAVVPIDIVYDADLRGVFTVLREASQRFRAENDDVLADTEIDGITAFGATTMTVRTSTRVKPGRHEAAAAALRFWIKEAFDRRAAGAPRPGLVPPKATFSN
jgi:small conductance mechanosensitive channel